MSNAIEKFTEACGELGEHYEEAEWHMRLGVFMLGWNAHEKEQQHPSEQDFDRMISEAEPDGKRVITNIPQHFTKWGGEPITSEPRRRDYDHAESRCEEMRDYEDHYLPFGATMSCCICDEHDCEVYAEYLMRHYKLKPRGCTCASCDQSFDEGVYLNDGGQEICKQCFDALLDNLPTLSERRAAAQPQPQRGVRNVRLHQSGPRNGKAVQRADR